MGETCIQHYSKSSLLYAFWYLLPHAFSTHFYASFNNQLLINVYQSIAISFSVYDFSHFFFKSQPLFKNNCTHLLMYLFLAVLCLGCSCTGFFLTGPSGAAPRCGGGFSLPWLLLLQTTGSGCAGCSRCCPEAQYLQPSGCRVGARWLCPVGFVALRKVESSPTRDPTHVPCIGRQILTQDITREVLISATFIAIQNMFS